MDFYELTRDKIELRRGLLQQYGLKCLNYSDSKIGEALMLKLYCEATGKNEDKVRKMRTSRKVFKFRECIPEYISYVTEDFNGLLDYLKGIEVETLKESFNYTFDYKGFEFVLGTGGIHGCIKEGVYEQDEENLIVDADVGSLLHLKNCKGLCGFNNNGFDYPVIHNIIQNQEYLIAHDAEFVANWIYEKAQAIITQEYSSIKQIQNLCNFLNVKA